MARARRAGPPDRALNSRREQAGRSGARKLVRGDGPGGQSGRDARSDWPAGNLCHDSEALHAYVNALIARILGGCPLAIRMALAMMVKVDALTWPARLARPALSAR